MAEDNPAPPLPRRVPGDNRHTPGDRQGAGTGQAGPLVLSEPVLQRIRAALDSVADEAPPREDAAPTGQAAPLPRRAPRPGNGPDPSAPGRRRAGPGQPPSQPIPPIAASAPSEVASPPREVTSPPDEVTSPPREVTDQATVRPGATAQPWPAAARPAEPTLVPAQRSPAGRPADRHDRGDEKAGTPEQAKAGPPQEARAGTREKANEGTAENVKADSPEKTGSGTPEKVDAGTPEKVPGHQENGQAAPRERQARRPGASARPARPAPHKAPSPSGSARRAGAHRGRRITGAMIMMSALLSAGSLAFLLTRHGGQAMAQSDSPGASSQAISDRAAAWVASQVSRDVRVSCDPQMCHVLEAHGLPATGLMVLRPGAADLLRSTVIVATAEVRSMVGSRLLNDAPAAIASFGSGSRQISVRLVIPQGAAAYSATLGRDIAARRGGGTSLLQNPRITVSAAARPQLAEGQVDSRIMLTVAILASKWPISIVAFGDIAPGASPGIPFRSVDVAPAPGTAGPQAAALLQQMAAYLGTSPGSYPATHVSIVTLAGGREILRVEFAAPSPPGLLGG